MINLPKILVLYRLTDLSQLATQVKGPNFRFPTYATLPKVYK